MDNNSTSRKGKNQEKKKIKKRQDPWYVATMLLGVRMRSVAEMRLRLRKKGFSDEQVESTVGTCQKFGYLNDKQFAEMVCNSILTTKLVGRRMVLQKLKQYKLDEKIISKTIGELLTPEKEKEMALKAAQKKEEQLERRKIDKKLWRPKIVQFLAGKGFSFETIQDATRNHLDDI